ncbi:MAG: histidine kinase N-terminal 7TM domain-containing protein [Salinirussus sp.]
MAWQPTAYALVALAAAAISAGVVAVGWNYRSEPTAESFVGLMAAVGGWALLYGIQLGFTAPAAQLPWQRRALAVGGLIPTLWLLFTIQYTDREEWLSRPVLAAIAVDPILFGLLTLTNPLHGLVWRGASFVAGSPQALELALGPGYFVHIAYAYLAIGAGLVLLGLAITRSTLYRRQAGLLILGTVPPTLANVVFTLRVEWGPLPAIDFTPMAFVLTGIFFGTALFGFDLLERVPLARERVFTGTDDGLVVVDGDGEILAANPTARRILESPADGRRIDERLPTGTELTDQTGPSAEGDGVIEGLDGQTVRTDDDGRPRVYDVSCSSLSGRDDRTVGHVVELRDITDRDRYEQRLEVANRVLRHNLRNQMNVVRGWAEQIVRDDSGQSARAGRRIAETAEELIDLGEKARTMVSMADLAGGSDETVSVADSLAPLLDDLRTERAEGVRVEASLPPDLAVQVPDAELLTVAVENLLENAVEHNDADEPVVRVSAEAGEEGLVRISVADNGPAIPETERRVLAEGSETQLEHGSGLGLWLVNWSVTAAGGRVEFETDGARGNVVTLLFRSAYTGRRNC